MQEIQVPWVRKNPWRREWLPTSVFLPVELNGQRSLYSPWGCKESDKPEWLTLSLFHNKYHNNLDVVQDSEYSEELNQDFHTIMMHNFTFITNNIKYFTKK